MRLFFRSVRRERLVEILAAQLSDERIRRRGRHGAVVVSQCEQTRRRGRARSSRHRQRERICMRVVRLGRARG